MTINRNGREDNIDLLTRPNPNPNFTHELSLNFAVPARNQAMLQELLKYAAVHGFKLSIEDTVANVTMPQSALEPKNFINLMLRLELEFEKEMEEEHMEKNNKKGGWHEEKDPTFRNEKGKSVARRHSEAATSEKLKDTLGKPMQKEEKDENQILPLMVKKDKAGQLRKYAEANGINLLMQDRVTMVTAPKSKLNALWDFLDNNGIVKGVSDTGDESAAVDVDEKED